MAGVGPFSIPAAKKKGAVVYANDLNPASYHWLCENVKLNKVHSIYVICTVFPNILQIEGNIHTFNMDGREFIRKMVHDSSIGRPFNHFIMNLPATAIEFLG